VEKQICISCRDIIQELKVDLHSVANDLTESMAATAPDSLLENWKKLIAYHHKIEQRLLNQISGRLDEIESPDFFDKCCGKFDLPIFLLDDSPMILCLLWLSLNFRPEYLKLELKGDFSIQHINHIVI
jgi:hypothetical protein